MRRRKLSHRLEEVVVKAMGQIERPAPYDLLVEQLRKCGVENPEHVVDLAVNDGLIYQVIQGHYKLTIEKM